MTKRQVLSLHHGTSHQCTLKPAIFLFLLAVTLLLQSCGPEFLVVTSFDRAFPEKWTHTPKGNSPIISATDTIYPGIPVMLQIFFRHYSRDDSGKAELSFSYKIITPRGKVFYDTSDITAFSGDVPRDSVVLLSSALPIITFPSTEIPGTYRIVVTAMDRIKRTRKTLTRNITLSTYPIAGDDKFDDFSFNVWVHNYCITPDPARAVAAFSYFINSTISNNDAVFWPVFYFFQCLFRETPALSGYLINDFTKKPSRLQEYTVFLLRATGYEKSASNTTIPDTLWKTFDKVANDGYLDPLAMTFKTGSNQLLEFGFYYFGRYDIIRFLIDCLGVGTPAGYDFFLTICKEYGDDCIQSFTPATARRLSSEAAAILRKACLHHQLIHSYCRFAFDHDALHPDAKMTLGAILALQQ